ncbi:MAG: DNA polymerase III subunit alpha [Candidatus Marinimicrobia bacterium]|nr:DNA polymerase III subunit alpha [Candidatus Neomarinimicrobiota bacterium]
MKKFIHLHNHSDLSLLDGAMSVQQLVDRAVELNMEAIALTEHGNMLSTIAFYKAAREAGIKPIIGCEVYITEDRKNRVSTQKGHGNYFHLILLAMSNKGYKNLVKIVSNGYTEGFYYKPRIDKEILRQYNEDLICLSGCIAGEPQQAIVEGNYEKAKALCLEYAEIFPDRYYLEIQNHNLDDEVKWRQAAIQISKETGIPRVATNDAHYAKQEHWEAHDVHICIGMQKEYDDPKRLRYEPYNYWLKTQEEMEELFPGDSEVIDNTVVIAERCNIDIVFGEYHLPKFQIPAPFENEDDYLRHLTYQGLDERFNVITDEIKDRTELELNVIKQMKFAGYFLIVQEFVNWAKDHDIPVGPGRGSAAGSLVCFAIKITDINPLPYDLLFERFLNPERVSMPDIDIDFDDERRQEVIDHIKEKYGHNSVCNIITFGKMKAKGVLRDVGRVLGIPLNEVDQIVKLFESTSEKTLKDALKNNKEIKAKAEESRKYKKLFDIAKVLEGSHRQHGVHAAGVLIAPGDLTNYLPIQIGKEDVVTSQYDMKCIDDIGLLKADFLGLRNLSVINRTLKMLRQKGIEVDIHHLPMNDEKTFELFGAGKTIGVFQFESEGMRKHLAHLKPNCLEDLVAMNALYRPGPMDHIESFINRKLGVEEIKYHHPKMEPILKNTYGIIVYQEQVMQVGQAIGGFSLGKADLMRRAMGKKKIKILEEMEEEFVNGAKQQNIEPKLAEDIYALLYKFASYGFNKSHSVAYAYLAYQIGYLKAHFPAEFMAANLTSEMGVPGRVIILSKEVADMGMELLPPNINYSEVYFKPEGQGIRFGLNAIKNVGKTAAQNVVDTCHKHGPFTSFYKFVDELDLRLVNKKTLESLVIAGACDDCEGTRAQKFHAIDEAVRHAKKIQEEHKTNQVSLFGIANTSQSNIISDPKLPQVKPWSDKEKLNNEKEMVGLYLSGHPLIRYETELETLSNYRFDKPLGKCGLNYIKTGGMITGISIRLDKKERKYARFLLEGLEGSANVMVFSNVYDQFKEFIYEDAVVFVEGRVDLKFGDGSIQAEKVTPLEGAIARKTKKMHIQVPIEIFQNLELNEIHKMFTEFSGDCEVMFHVFDNHANAKTVRLRDLRIDPTVKFFNHLHKYIAKENIRLE